jgi:hypothetical protein
MLVERRKVNQLVFRVVTMIIISRNTSLFINILHESLMNFIHSTVLYLSLCLINEARRHEDTWRSGGIASPFLTSVLDEGERSASRLGHFTPGKIALVSIGYEAGCAPEPVWTLSRREKSGACRESDSGLSGP